MGAVSSSIVIIGPADSLPHLQERFESGAEARVFSDADALEALDHIIRQRPHLIAIERTFSSSSRGRALINRINDDPTLAGCEVRIVAPDSALSRVAGGSKRPPHGVTAVAVDEPKSALDQRGTRRAARVRVADGVEVLVDGNTARLIDVSVVGVQVVSASVLKPNQRVRVAVSDGQGVIRCSGAVAWASFEMPKGLPPRYRAGINLLNADAEALSGFAERHRRP
jgi:hypothetical protein